MHPGSRRSRRAPASVVTVGLVVAVGLVLGVAAACGTDEPASPASPTPSGGDAGAGDPSDAAGEPGQDAAGDPDGGDADADGSGDAAPPDAEAGACASEGGLPPVADDGQGETCTGFGEGTPCDPACGLPRYGYVCVGGSPPGIAGCRIQREGGLLGSTYCCAQEACVRQPDQDPACAGEGPRTRRFQCAAHADGGLEVAPPADCREVGEPLPGSRFYCCRP